MAQAEGATAMRRGNLPGRRGKMRASRGPFFYAFLFLALFLMITPIGWLVLTSLKTQIEYLAYPVKVFPAIPQWRNYHAAVTLIPFLRHLWNSVFLSGMYAGLCVLSSALVGFGFARHDVPGKQFLFMLVISVMMVPSMVNVVPQFMVFARLNLIGNYLPWALWGITGSPWHIFLFRQFFATIPQDLMDAAEVDGCNRLRVFWQIFVPNSGPILATSLIFNFQHVWGDWLYPLIFLRDDLTTLSVKLSSGVYSDSRGLPFITITMAAVVLYVLPMIVVFFLAQKQIIQGVIMTGLKG